VIEHYIDLAGNIIKVEQINGEYTIINNIVINETSPAIAETYIYVLKRMLEKNPEKHSLYKIEKTPQIYEPTPITILKVIVISTLPEYEHVLRRNVFLATIQNQYVKLVGPSHIEINKPYTYYPHSKQSSYIGQARTIIMKNSSTKILTYPICIFTTITKTEAIKLLLEETW